MAEQVTVAQAQEVMDEAVASKARSDRDFQKAQAMRLGEYERAAEALADAFADDKAEMKAARQAVLKADNAAIAKAGAMVRKASQVESRARAEAKAATQEPSAD